MPSDCVGEPRLLIPTDFKYTSVRFIGPLFDSVPAGALQLYAATKGIQLESVCRIHAWVNQYQYSLVRREVLSIWKFDPAPCEGRDTAWFRLYRFRGHNRTPKMDDTIHGIIAQDGFHPFAQQSPQRITLSD